MCLAQHSIKTMILDRTGFNGSLTGRYCPLGTNGVTDWLDDNKSDAFGLYSCQISTQQIQMFEKDSGPSCLTMLSTVLQLGPCTPSSKHNKRVYLLGKMTLCPSSRSKVTWKKCTEAALFAHNLSCFYLVSHTFVLVALYIFLEMSHSYFGIWLPTENNNVDVLNPTEL